MDTYQFTQQLRYNRTKSPGFNFIEHANNLKQLFNSKHSKSNINNANLHRADFVNYIDLIRFENSLNTSIEHLENFKNEGLVPALYALTLLQVTRRSGDFLASESLLKAASQEYPKNNYVLQQYLQSVFANGNLETLGLSFDQILLRDLSGLEPNDRLRYAEIAAHSAMWDAVGQLVPPNNDGLDKTQEYKTALLKKRIQISKNYINDSNKHFETLFINLTEDTRKLKLSENLFRKMGIELQRHDAINGRGLSDYIISDALARNVSRQDFGNGAIACALSHIAAWEKALDKGSDHTLILEDDAIPYSWQTLDLTHKDQSKADIFYVNDRMSSVHLHEFNTGEENIWNVLGRWPQGRQGWGLDGYVISKEGASKLLEAFSQDRIIGHIDGQVGAYGIITNSADAVDLPVSHAQQVGLNMRRSLKSGVNLKAICLNFPMTSQTNFGYSSIRTVSGESTPN